MDYNKCNDCFYFDVCSKSDMCDDFSPITTSDEDEYIEAVIEEGRSEYREAWNEYIKDYQG